MKHDALVTVMHKSASRRFTSSLAPNAAPAPFPGELQPVVHHNHTGCGDVCVAALTGRTYLAVKRAAAKLGIVVEDPRLWSGPEPMRKLLGDFGVAASNGEEPFTTWPRLPGRALLAIKWHRDASGPALHWVVFARDGSECRV